MSDTLQLPAPTWFVGCGNMGQAIVEGWRSAGIDLSNTIVIRPSAAPVGGVRTVATAVEAGAPPALVVLGIKPQKLDEVALDLRPRLSSKTVLVSLLAGSEAATLRNRFPGVAAVVRAMPNLPVSIRRGVTGLYTADADDKVKRQLGDLFVALGFAMWMADEGKLSALAAVAGAGPAYVARFIAALAKAGEARGLSKDIATTLAVETVLGTGWMAASTQEGMDEIARRVASPQGTTQAGLNVLDAGNALDDLVGKTVEAAVRRGAELAETARGPLLAEGASLH